MAQILCEICGKNPARFTVEKYYNGTPVRVHVCAYCAREITRKNQSESREKRCRVCGKSMREISADFTVGCAYCYVEFKDELAPIIAEVQSL